MRVPRVTFGLVHGAAHGAWCWERVIPELEARGYRVVAPDLPCDDPDAGIDEYADVVVAALADHGDVVLVGHSLGSLTIPVVARRRPVRQLVFLCSVPTGPGTAIDADLARMVTPAFLNARRTVDEHDRESFHPADAIAMWFDDCTPGDAAWAASMLRPQSRRPLVKASPLDEWPAVPVEVILARDDRCVNMSWAIPAATARLGGRAPILIDGGHSPFITRPRELADALVATLTP